VELLLMSPRRRPSAEGDVLRACVATDGETASGVQLSEALDRADPSQLLEAARFHRVAAYVHERLAHEPELTEPYATVVDELGAQREEQFAHQVRCLASLRLVVEVMDRHGWAWLLFKGPVLAALHRRMDLRSYGDLDVLVDHRQLREVVTALEEAGCRALVDDWSLYARVLPGELQILTPHGVVVDLHWHLINSSRVRRSFRVDVQEVLDERRPVEVGGMSVPAMKPVHAFVHLVLHAALAGAHRICWLKDVDVAAQRCDDWEPVRSVSQQWGADVALATVLLRARRTLGGDVAAGALRHGRPSAWAVLAACTEYLYPVVEGRVDHSLPRLVARASRPTGAKSWGELARRSRAHSRAETVTGGPRYAVAAPDAAASYYSAVSRAGADGHVGAGA
jgi:hypothetical protein